MFYAFDIFYDSVRLIYYFNENQQKKEHTTIYWSWIPYDISFALQLFGRKKKKKKESQLFIQLYTIWFEINGTAHIFLFFFRLWLFSLHCEMNIRCMKLFIGLSNRFVRCFCDGIFRSPPFTSKTEFRSNFHMMLTKIILFKRKNAFKPNTFQSNYIQLRKKFHSHNKQNRFNFKNDWNYNNTKRKNK